MNFAERVKILRTEKGLSQKKLADNFNLDATTVAKWELGSFPNENTIKGLCEYFNVSTDYLLGLSDIRVQGLKESRWAEVMVIKNEKPYKASRECFIDLPRDMVEKNNDHNYFITKILDDSMLPFIDKADLLLFKKDEPVKTGDIVLVAVGTSEGMVKKYVEKDNEVELQSFNPYYPTTTYSKDKVKIYGVLKNSIKSF
ncbi:MAG: XRE family transcriptional regulator [Clostridia bacterium]|nr:XRE family transcriptional regulator [Clostridia bacterium]